MQGYLFRKNGHLARHMFSNRHGRPELPEGTSDNSATVAVRLDPKRLSLMPLYAYRAGDVDLHRSPKRPMLQDCRRLCAAHQ